MRRNPVRADPLVQAPVRRKRAPEPAPHVADHNPPPHRVLEALVRSTGVDLDGFRISLWAAFYTTPVFGQIERRFGLLRDENNVLFCLAHAGQLTAKTICQVLGRPKNTISRAVDRLLQRRLIRRDPLAADRRHALLTLEPAGRHLIEQTTKLFAERQTDMLRALSPAERRALDRILTKLIADAEHWLAPLA